MTLLPLLEILTRRAFGVQIPGAGPIVQHLVLWVGFAGAAIAGREGKLLAVATGSLMGESRLRRDVGVVVAAVASCAAALLAWGGVELVVSERAASTTIGAGIPTWIAQLVLPAGFAVVAVHLVCRAAS